LYTSKDPTRDSFPKDALTSASNGTKKHNWRDDEALAHLFGDDSSICFFANSRWSSYELCPWGLVTTLYVPLFITILLLSVITGSYSSLLLNRFVDQKQLKQSQAKMREFQQVYREAQLAGDKGKLKKLEKERAEVMELSMDVQAQTMRPMPYILIISLPLFGWLSYTMSQAGSWPTRVSTMISLPYFGTLPYTQGVILVFRFGSFGT